MLGRFAVLSFIIHALIILAVAFGFITHQTDILELPQPIAVELVDTIEETSKTNELPNPQHQIQKKPTEDIKKEPEKEAKPEPQKPEFKPESKPEPQLEPAKESPFPPDEEITKNIPEDVVVPEKTPEKPTPEPPVVKPPQQKPKPPKKPVEKQAPKQTPKKPRQDANDFDSLLKNLTKSEPAKSSSNAGELSDKLAASELDAVRKQIESVWRLPAGIKDAHKYTVIISLEMRPDRTVKNASIAPGQDQNDPTFRVLAESALRAVNEFTARPLKLPVNRYKVWKRINMQFDPRHLL